MIDTIINGDKLFVIAGPCVIESEKQCFDIAEKLSNFFHNKAPYVFKASYDKANRSSYRSFRGPGLNEGLRILKAIKESLRVAVLTDVHCVRDIPYVAEVVDIIQIPAFLCRQTDLLMTAASTGKIINVKKGQFMSPWDMRYVVEKIKATGNNKILLTERGTTFGYNNLVVDMRSIYIMKEETSCRIVFDMTHSVQRPALHGECSGGDASLAPFLARAAVAAGCDGIFAEVFIAPSVPKCDAENSIELDEFIKLWKVLERIYNAVH